MKKTLSLLVALVLMLSVITGLTVASADEAGDPVEFSMIGFCSEGFTPTTDNWYTDLLLEKFNAALKELTEDGTVPGIIEKYIPSKID